MLNNKFMVEMPKEKITFNSSNKPKTEYVYFSKRAYRNSKGQPTSEKVLIGKKDPESGMLVPNKNYYELFEKEEVLPTKSIQDFGSFYVLQSIFEELGLYDILENIFANDYEKIITMAMYMLCEGNVLYYCDDWYSETYTYLTSPITSQSSSQIFENISYEDRMDFFKVWTKMNLNSSDEYIAYDVTSFSSYSKGNDNLEWGYNRDKEKLPQFNLGMYFGELSKIPLYYCVYPGSIVDKSHLQYMMQDNKTLGIEDIKFVLDNGFYSLPNIKYMVSKGYPFIICVSNTLKASKAILEKYKGLLNGSRYYSKKHDIYSVSENTKIYGINSNIHIFYDPTKAMLDENELYKKINILENRLSQIEEKPTKKQLKQFNKYFKITENKDGSIGYERNFENIDNEKLYNGIFMLLTTDFDKNSDDILEIYRNKDVIEKSFDNLKNSMDMKRIRCHNKSTTDGKIFVSFLSLVLKSHMENKLSEYMHNNNSTIEKVLRELKKIKVVTLHDGKRLMNPLTKKQKKILENFDIIEEDIKEFVLGVE